MKPCFLLSIVVLFLGAFVASAQIAETALPIADQRSIIEILLKEKFDKSSDETIFISTANLPAEIREEFSPLKNKKVRFVSTQNSDVCAYEFGKFEFIEKYVSVTFGDCREGLAYDFMKSGSSWKSVGLIITKPILY